MSLKKQKNRYGKFNIDTLIFLLRKEVMVVMLVIVMENIAFKFRYKASRSKGKDRWFHLIKCSNSTRFSDQEGMKDKVNLG